MKCNKRKNHRFYFAIFTAVIHRILDRRIQLFCHCSDKLFTNYFKSDILLFAKYNFVTPQKRRLRHFCIALTVTRKFRLCLHPLGSLVSSRYTFSIAKAWLGVFCFILLFRKTNHNELLNNEKIAH